MRRLLLALPFALLPLAVAHAANNLNTAASAPMNMASVA